VHGRRYEVRVSEGRLRLCLALDVDAAAPALALVDELADYVGVFKLGLELFVAEGPALVQAVRARGVDVFLDLKLHDIPATVGAAVRRAIALDVKFLTIHASGGAAMMRAAVDAADGKTAIVAVTALTSLSDRDLAEVGYAVGADALVLQLAAVAERAGVAGVVCSPREAAAIKKQSPRLLAVTPGIRSATDHDDDQQRTMGPTQAIAEGADLLVVGRPIRTAIDRRAAAAAFVDAIEAARRPCDG
jgi:orotidine-5'-phosphate decarboxylase